MYEFCEYRNGNIFLITETVDDGVFWQYQEGARKRVPLASGVSSPEYVADLVQRFENKGGKLRYFNNGNNGEAK